MAKKSKSLRDVLADAKSMSGRNSQIDIWLSKKAGRREELMEAVSWFSDHRDSSFGWEAFHKALTGFDGWGDFPVGVKALQSFVTKRGLDVGSNHAD